MIRPQRPQPPTPKYDHSVYVGSYAHYDEQLRRYQLELLEYVASLLETTTKREEPRVRFGPNDGFGT